VLQSFPVLSEVLQDHVGLGMEFLVARLVILEAFLLAILLQTYPPLVQHAVSRLICCWFSMRSIVS
jgi:hypothetical protein